MSTTGQFSSKNPTIKRILKEASELANHSSADYHAAPLEADLFEWHFTLRGPPAPSPFEGGVYHGRIVLPPAYPLKPPSFRFLTPTGRFEVNREICLSISGHHEETWQPAWGIRTALVAIRSFMDTSASGQLGGMEASEEVRKRMAGQSAGWKCPACAKTNAEIMREQEETVREQGAEAEMEETVPEELRLAYREDLAQKPEPAKETNGGAKTPALAAPASEPNIQAENASPQPAPAPQTQAAPQQHPAQPPQQQPAQPQRQNEEIPPWIDKAIYGVVGALVFLVWRKWFW
ncbi:hypothetical protein BAUCODRAFT_32569 [Baudoinia panamericana UAMH 10762]|uniref:UBC core domain-containing protein n=1 Tax=Baudoinia panamericana (strain UAMH 10762) TaxID=717646 RepID=M2N3I5_BAUPA|nr:uncharacterized protein BAUCODRAFT_32569 [Baudoinia panamericana UAMH 10762]EMC98518.1 hypothetical protein BAUCODRAFT_32569 [Baudoinia panamericana UAMH 10762]